MFSDADFTKAIDSGELGIEPYDQLCQQPCSYDMTLSSTFVTLGALNRVKEIDFTKDYSYHGDWVVMSKILLQPKQMILGATFETVKLSNNLAARLDGKSSLARMGLMVHTTAGFIDAGFEGTITLELVNLMDVPMWLRAGMPIAQLSVFRLDTPATAGYDGKYQHQHQPQVSKYHENWESHEAQ